MGIADTKQPLRQSSSHQVIPIKATIELLREKRSALKDGGEPAEARVP